MLLLLQFSLGLGKLCVEEFAGIAQVSNEHNVPIIFGVLTTDTMQQALERAGIKNNLGWNYALQAIEMGSLIKNLN